MMNELTDEQQQVLQVTQMTATNLRKLVADTTRHKDTASHISVPEREELIELISQILPAGNVVGFIFSGIMNVKDREIPPGEGRTHFNSLFKGLSIVRNNAFYRMMFAGPATVLVGYNMLLRLAGGQPDDFLPEGAWQFYVEFGLREDAARHSNETLGFQQAAAQLHPPATEAQELTSWVLASMWLLRDYDYLIATLWEEHTRLTVIEETTGLPNLHRTWGRLRPFSSATQGVSIPAYRRQRFDLFCEEQLRSVGTIQRRHFDENWRAPENQAWRQQAVRTYQQQLSIRSHLEAGEYSEKRVPIRNSDMSIGIIINGNYHLIPFIDPVNPTAFALAQTQVEAILRGKHSASDLDLTLTNTPRASQAELRKLLDKTQQQSLSELRKAPIFINWDKHNSNQPLTYIRQTHRGIGDHPITLFRTESSMVFDFSHIYFDGAWAMEVAEMLTNEAITQLRRRDSGNNITGHTIPFSITLNESGKFQRAAGKITTPVNFVSAEAKMPITPVVQIRKLLVSRTKPTVHLTVNDLLVLYRTIFNQRYQPSPILEKSLTALRRQPGGEVLVRAVKEMLTNMRDVNPSLMIPIEASRVNPRDRIFPSTFRSPFPDFHQKHNDLLSLRKSIIDKREHKAAAQQFFVNTRAEYLSTLQTFGMVMRKYREIAASGQSMSTTAIRLIAGLPGAMQKVVDGLPGHFSFINEAIKGEEVFSNVGQVTPGSSISRFSSAKDDNDKKILVWGVMTDNDNMLKISLRDFRIPIIALVRAGHQNIAQEITEDFVSSFMTGFKTFIDEVSEIITISRN